jgi:ADP-dependent NAD(P)H-hydrate dehydratase / NAD(P)H-hydrate epimerase
MRIIDQIVVNTDQMRAIENRMFEAGMPIAALMEKVGCLLAQRIQVLYPLATTPTLGVLAGPGHNGADALVVARELHMRGYRVAVWSPLKTKKALNASHAQYVRSLGIPWVQDVAELTLPDLWIDGLFGFGLDRLIDDEVASGIEWVNKSDRPIISIDLPSGIHTDTGITLGCAIQATRTLCLGLWKLGVMQDIALESVGAVELIDFDIPLRCIESVLDAEPSVQRLTVEVARRSLPWPQSRSTHKYQRGHLLLVAGSHKYRGAVVLAGMGARASGVGMLTIAVPESMVESVSLRLPEAIVIGCPETPNGAIELLPDSVNPDSYSAVAFGPGVSLEAVAAHEKILRTTKPLILDADGLNLLARMGTIKTLRARKGMTVLTPHPGEFERLFPDVVETGAPAYSLARKAAEISGAVIALKGGRMVVSRPHGPTWINPDSTPALARGGSGDVLTGLMGGLLAIAQRQPSVNEDVIKTAIWWHAQAGMHAAAERTVFGVDAWTLSQALIPALGELVGDRLGDDSMAR